MEAFHRGQVHPAAASLPAADRTEPSAVAVRPSAAATPAAIRRVVTGSDPPSFQRASTGTHPCRVASGAAPVAHPGHWRAPEPARSRRHTQHLPAPTDAFGLVSVVLLPALRPD